MHQLPPDHDCTLTVWAMQNYGKRIHRPLLILVREICSIVNQGVRGRFSPNISNTLLSRARPADYGPARDGKMALT